MPPPPLRRRWRPLALGALGGAVVGFAIGQPTISFLIGLGLGILAALLIWWRTR